MLYSLHQLFFVLGVHMTEDEIRTLRLLIREETNAAVYASEDRIVTHVRPLERHMEGLQGHMEGLQGHMERFDERMEQFEGRMDRFEVRMGRFEVCLDRLEGDQRDIKANMMKFETNLSETISVIDDVTRVINDLQASQRALELKLEDNLLGMRKELQRLNETIHTFAREFITMHVQTNDRITWHERTPINETHPKPHSAA
jgi:chromosome segregation ATPase